MGGHDREHRKYSPSQAERFFACRGSTNLLKRVPARAPSVYALEGTKAHTVLEAALKNGVRRAADAHREFSVLCMEDLNTHGNFFYYSIQVALNHIYDILDEHEDAVLYTERFVDVPSQSAPGEAGGYCDVGIHVPSLRRFYVIDYKHGEGIAKAVKGNKQVRQYGAGFLYEDDAKVDPATVDEVVLTIIQPRAFHPDGMIREEIVTPYELYEYLEEMDEAIADNEKDDAPLTPDDNGRTTDHCRFCDANTVCPAREAKALSVVGTQFRTVEQLGQPKLPLPHELDIERLAMIRMYGPMLRKWLDDVDAHLFSLAMSGVAIPGAKLVDAQERREWYGDPEETAKKAAALADVPVDDIMVKKLMPLTQVEKLVVEAFKKRAGRGKKQQAAADARQAFAFLTDKKSSGNLTLVDEDDTRPAVNRAHVHFGQIAAALPAPTIDH